LRFCLFDAFARTNRTARQQEDLFGLGGLGRIALKRAKATLSRMAGARNLNRVGTIPKPVHARRPKPRFEPPAESESLSRATKFRVINTIGIVELS
jgi:hypothetical protein